MLAPEHVDLGFIPADRFLQKLHLVQGLREVEQYPPSHFNGTDRFQLFPEHLLLRLASFRRSFATLSFIIFPTGSNLSLVLEFLQLRQNFLLTDDSLLEFLIELILGLSFTELEF